jgi:hypothetical protein
VNRKHSFGAGPRGIEIGDSAVPEARIDRDGSVFRLELVFNALIQPAALIEQLGVYGIWADFRREGRALADAGWVDSFIPGDKWGAERKRGLSRPLLKFARQASPVE